MSNTEKYLVIIGGATATGKTAMAIEVAKHFNTEIISADSRQFYKEMNIGTAKPSDEELKTVPHHFINSLSIHDEYSVGDFERDALGLLNKLYEKRNVVVMAGGSGLFIRALCEGLDEFPDVPESVRKELDESFKKEGIEPLQQELLEKDPAYYRLVDLNNPQRLIRALSVCRASGRPFSDFQKKEKQPRPFTPLYILLDMDREMLYRRINSRVDKMMQQGLLEEARALFPFRHLNSLQTVGYQELFRFLEGEITLERAVELIKQNSRRYAKRQMTWFRKDAHREAFLPENREEVISFLKEKTG